jgi:hypothetical protein
VKAGFLVPQLDCGTGLSARLHRPDAQWNRAQRDDFITDCAMELRGQGRDKIEFCHEGIYKMPSFSPMKRDSRSPQSVEICVIGGSLLSL